MLAGDLKILQESVAHNEADPEISQECIAEAETDLEHQSKFFSRLKNAISLSKCSGHMGLVRRMNWLWKSARSL